MEEVPALSEGFRVVIIGAGMSGICMAVRLQAAGIDYVILEKDAGPGRNLTGNVHPGCGVDTPSHFHGSGSAPCRRSSDVLSAGR
ncbi:FAD-dependent oxidoreductase [Spirillospora sp. CA-255316]